MPEIAPSAEQPRPQLTLTDTVCLMVGIIVGAGIFETSPRVAAAISDPNMLLAVWCLGGLMALIGALCYAELAAMLPHNGGDYWYLRTAFGSKLSLVFPMFRLELEE